MACDIKLYQRPNVYPPLFTLKAHNQMEIYAQVIGDDATAEDHKAIAAHFEKQGDSLQAGRAWLRAGDPTTVCISIV